MIETASKFVFSPQPLVSGFCLNVTHSSIAAVAEGEDII
jgi:hypothetical protein